MSELAVSIVCRAQMELLLNCFDANGNLLIQWQLLSPLSINSKQIYRCSFREAIRDNESRTEFNNDYDYEENEF